MQPWSHLRKSPNPFYYYVIFHIEDNAHTKFGEGGGFIFCLPTLVYLLVFESFV